MGPNIQKKHLTFHALLRFILHMSAVDPVHPRRTPARCPLWTPRFNELSCQRTHPHGAWQIHGTHTQVAVGLLVGCICLGPWVYERFGILKGLKRSLYIYIYVRLVIGPLAKLKGFGGHPSSHVFW